MLNLSGLEIIAIKRRWWAVKKQKKPAPHGAGWSNDQCLEDTCDLSEQCQEASQVGKIDTAILIEIGRS